MHQHSWLVRSCQDIIYPLNIPMKNTVTVPTIGKGYWEKAPLGAVLVPRKIWLDESDQTLCWTWLDDSKDQPEPGQARRGLLEDFLLLHAADEKPLLAFARTYGPLLLCKHGRPYTHNPQSASEYPNVRVEMEPFLFASLAESEPSGWSYEGCLPTGKEPLRIWRKLSLRLWQLFSIASELREGRVAPRQAVEDLSLPALRTVGMGREDVPRTLEQQQLWVMHHMQALLSTTGLRLHFDWSADAPKWYLCSPTVYGLVVYQLLVELMRGADFTICSHCSEPFFPSSRRRPSGRKHWCYEEACQKASRATANRAYRKRKRAERM